MAKVYFVFLMRLSKFIIYVSRFLSTENGFKYLSETDWITSELHQWKQAGNVAYVENLGTYSILAYFFITVQDKC